MRGIIVLFLVLAWLPVGADEYQDIVEQAFQALDNDYRNSWSFTETSTVDEQQGPTLTLELTRVVSCHVHLIVFRRCFCE